MTTNVSLKKHVKNQQRKDDERFKRKAIVSQRPSPQLWIERRTERLRNRKLGR